MYLIEQPRRRGSGISSGAGRQPWVRVALNKTRMGESFRREGNMKQAPEEGSHVGRVLRGLPEIATPVVRGRKE